MVGSSKIGRVELSTFSYVTCSFYGGITKEQRKIITLKAGNLPLSPEDILKFKLNNVSGCEKLPFPVEQSVRNFIVHNKNRTDIDIYTKEEAGDSTKLYIATAGNKYFELNQGVGRLYSSLYKIKIEDSYNLLTSTELRNKLALGEKVTVEALLVVFNKDLVDFGSMKKSAVFNIVDFCMSRALTEIFIFYRGNLKPFMAEKFDSILSNKYNIFIEGLAKIFEKEARTPQEALELLKEGILYYHLTFKDAFTNSDLYYIEYEAVSENPRELMSKLIIEQVKKELEELLVLEKKGSSNNKSENSPPLLLKTRDLKFETQISKNGLSQTNSLHVEIEIGDGKAKITDSSLPKVQFYNKEEFEQRNKFPKDKVFSKDNISLISPMNQVEIQYVKSEKGTHVHALGYKPGNIIIQYKGGKEIPSDPEKGMKFTIIDPNCIPHFYHTNISNIKFRGLKYFSDIYEEVDEKGNVIDGMSKEVACLHNLIAEELDNKEASSVDAWNRCLETYDFPDLEYSELTTADSSFNNSEFSAVEEQNLAIKTIFQIAGTTVTIEGNYLDIRDLQGLKDEMVELVFQQVEAIECAGVGKEIGSDIV